MLCMMCVFGTESSVDGDVIGARLRWKSMAGVQNSDDDVKWSAVCAVPAFKSLCIFRESLYSPVIFKYTRR